MAGIAEALYMHSPIWMQQLAVSAYGWWWYRRRFSKLFHQAVSEFKTREYWSAEQFRSYQEEYLGKVLAAAHASTYYQRIFLESGITEHTAPYEALRRLPRLSKETLRVSARELLTQHPLPKRTLVQRSSGTTGTPTEIFYTPQFHALELAVPEARNLNWAGVSYRDRRVMFGVRKVCDFKQSAPPFWRYSVAEDMAYASIYHLSPQFLPAYVEFLRAFKPKVVMGYPSALNAIARHALESNNLPAPATAVITTSETLTAHAREAIESAWQCKVYDRYGAVEGCLYASQCEYGSYHASPEVGVIEILDPHGDPCPPGVMGEVVCTGLQNTLQPLIRYSIGDVARWSERESCGCGRSLPMLEAIEGRFEDLCYTPDGRQMLRFDTVFKGVTSICEAQVVQEQLDYFAVYVVPTSKFSGADAQKITDNLRRHVGDVKSEVKTVPSISRSASGKFRAVVCKLPPEQRAALRATGADAGSTF